MAGLPPDPEGRIVRNDDVKGNVRDVAESVVASGKAKIVMSARLINFKVDSAKLKKPHEQFLETEVVPLLRKNPHFVCELWGTATYDKAGEVHNTKVADMRENEVALFLLRRGVSTKQVFGNPGLVVGEFGSQKGEDRSVLLHVLDPVATEFAVSLVDPLLLWQVLSGENVRPHWQVAFAIGDNNDLMSFYFFEPNDDDAMKRVVIIQTMPGDAGHGIQGVLNTASAVSTAEFKSANAQLFKPGDTKRGNFAQFMRVAFDKPSIGSCSTQVAVHHVEWGEFAGAIPGKLIYALGPVPTKASTPTRAIQLTPAQRTQALAAIGRRPRPVAKRAPVATVPPLARLRVPMPR